MKPRNIIKQQRKQQRNTAPDIFESAASNYSMLSLSDESFGDLLVEYKITELFIKAFDVLVDNDMLTNLSDFKYHGLKHSRQVMLNCYEGCLWEKLDTPAIRPLLVAAMFHDTKHSYGFQPDEVNIHNAISYLKQCNTEVEHKLTPDELKLATNCIRYTKYPYIKEGKIPASVDCIPYKIIRDADLMTVYDYISSEDLFVGLYNEISNQVDVSKSEFIQKQYDFISTISWNTQWAKKKSFNLNLPNINKNLHKYLLQLDFFKE